MPKIFKTFLTAFSNMFCHVIIWIYKRISGFASTNHLVCQPIKNPIQSKRGKKTSWISTQSAPAETLEGREWGYKTACSLWSFRIVQRISAHFLIVGRLCRFEATQDKDNSRIFSTAKFVAADLSSLGSKIRIASPSRNFFKACIIN